MPDLFVLTTSRVRLVWSGPAAEPTLPAGLVVEPLAGPVEVTARGGVAHLGDAQRVAALRLTEETAYPVLIQSRTGAPVALRHRDPVMVRGLTSSEGRRVVHGAVRFGATAGTSRFVVEVGGRPEFAFTVTVAPTKVSTADVAAMQADVEAQMAGLAVAYLAPSVQPARERHVRAAPRPVWLIRLREALPALETALAVVGRHPREGLVRPEGLVRAEQIQRPDAAVLRAVARGAGTGSLHRLPAPVRERLPARPVRRSLDTPEHRWLRAHVEAAARRLAAIRREEAVLPGGLRRAAVRAELDDLAVRLQRLRLVPLLADAAPDAAPRSVPLVLRTVPGYAEAYAALRRLGAGLALAEGEALVTPRDLAGLYEVWSYLAAARTLAAVLDQPMPGDSFFRATAQGVRLRLRRGRAHALTFRTGDGAVRLAYEPRFSAPPGLLAQRPDLLLTVAPAGAAPRLFVLDAKYRRDDSAAYRRRHGAPGPPEDALGDLHRYRDAIVTTKGGGVERPVEAAVALFPYREAEPGAFAAARLWTSIESIGVGAIPLLPGATGYLERWLRKAVG